MVKMNNEERNKANGILDGAFLLLILAVIIISFMLVKGINTNHDLQNDIDKLQAEKDKRVEQNEDAKTKNKAEIRRAGIKEVSDKADDFDKAFYDWRSWDEYSKNMDYLKKTYPNLKDSDKIDISGKVVGNGDSPISTFESTNMPTKTRGELMQIVEQTRESKSSENKTVWYKISNNDGGQYNVTNFESYSEVD